jgi:hypothetical protein
MFARASALLALAASLGAQTVSRGSGIRDRETIDPRPAISNPAFDRDPTHAPGRDLTVTLLTMGNGTEVWENFGHSAIWLRDNATGRDTVFNWGVFNMRAPHFILHFLQGLMVYSMGGDRLDQVLYAYRYWNRSVTAQELDLTPAQKDSLVAIINTNAQPENVHYRYDYFVENCATRPRDILDRVLGGQLRIGADSLSGTSYRWHALRLMQGDKPLVLGVDIGLGRPSDREITKWQEMFLPQKLHDWVATRQVKDSTGALHPLVKSERVLFQASRPPEPQAPPRFVWLWPVGAVLGVLLAAFGYAARKPGAGRITAATIFAIWSAVYGILGEMLTILWECTDHRFAHSNENLLLFNPLWLILAVTLPMTVLRGRAVTLSTRLLYVLAGLGVIALLAHAVGLSRQQNLAVIGLGLLPAIGLVIAIRQARNVQGRLA